MARVEKTSDVVEIHWENAISYGIGGLFFFFLVWLLVRYQGNGITLPLASVCGIIGLGLFGYGVKRAYLVRTVKSYAYTCPYCEGITELTAIANTDFSCIDCHRMIPIVDGDVIPIHQVRCGYCNELNFYSDKTEFLVCESCNHEIPISTEGSGRAAPKFMAIVEDNSLYELSLTGYGATKAEELIDCLQHMLAMNRGQVKNLLADLPATLMTGIPRRKAEMLQAQLSMHDAVAEAKPLV